MAIYYLDADDEITSAATRIRDTSDNRIALVLTAGSRVATSRINFLLLAREAKKRNKRLAIVTSDPSTQSVARSAELAVFGSVGEYERAESARLQGGAGAGGRGRHLRRSWGAGPDGVDAVVARSSRRRGRRRGPRPRGGMGGLRVPWPAVAAAFAIIIVLITGGLFFVYPSASVVLTLQEQSVGPLSLNVTVDPGTSGVNDVSATIPGLDKAFPLEATGTYTATGEKVNETPATGSVTFIEHQHRVRGARDSRNAGLDGEVASSSLPSKRSLSRKPRSQPERRYRSPCRR